jgi:predicted RNA polymerase sigma factor
MDAAGALAEVLKGEGPRVLATLARTIGDLAVAEDALSEATITALDAWPRTGIPGNPRAWLAVVAHNASAGRGADEAVVQGAAIRKLDIGDADIQPLILVQRLLRPNLPLHGGTFLR